MRVIFLGSPDFAVPSLEAIHSSKHEVVAVVTQPDRPFGRKLHLHAPAVKVAAQKLNLPILQPATTRAPEFVTELQKLGPDILVVVAYGEILRPAMLLLAPRGAINLHASLLPKYRGAAPIAWAIYNGDTTTGCSTMLVQQKMDAGPVYLQERCAIEESDTTGSLTGKLGHLGAPLLVQTLDLIERDAIAAMEQDAAAATFAPKLTREHGWIDWTRSASQIALQIRAFDPWPGTFSMLHNHHIKLWRARVSTETSTAAPGTILRSGRETIDVACGNGSILEILELQPENRPRLSAPDYAHGARLQDGIQFKSTPRVS